MSDETGWVIERYDSQGRLTYWNGTEPQYPRAFSTENLRAVRFARKQDAEACIAGMEMGFGSKAAEHMWCDNSEADRRENPYDYGDKP